MTEPDVAPRCSCGPHAIVFGSVPDPGCPFHGSHTEPSSRPAATDAADDSTEVN